ncbi:MAG: hypothetical protein ABIP33_06310 [Pseudolysinimonas sp.]
MAVADIPDDPDRRWAETFHQVAQPATAGEISAAQEVIDARELHRLDQLLGELPCEWDPCEFEAVIGAYQRHENRLWLVGVYCGTHREQLAKVEPLGGRMVWRHIFVVSSR